MKVTTSTVSTTKNANNQGATPPNNDDSPLFQPSVTVAVTNPGDPTDSPVATVIIGNMLTQFADEIISYLGNENDDNSSPPTDSSDDKVAPTSESGHSFIA